MSIPDTINWLQDGEDADALTLNRPLKEFLNLTNNELNNIAYKNKSNTFTANQTFNQPVYFNSTANLKGDTTIGDSISDTLNVVATTTFSNNVIFNGGAEFNSIVTMENLYINDTNNILNFYSSGPYQQKPSISWTVNSTSSNNMVFVSGTGILFPTAVKIQNASFGTATFALDPEWEQDYATANYVNQKLQELYDYLDARLATIEEKLGISTPATLARGITPREAINEIAVPKSKITELFERINSMSEYEGVLEKSNAEERMDLYKNKENEEKVFEIVAKIKERIMLEEEEQRQREEQERLELEAQNLQ